MMREIYADLACYHNYFQPVMKTIQKVYVDEIHYRRMFDQARPPLDRLAESGVLTDAHVERLLNLRAKVDILVLRERLETNTNKLWRFRMPENVTPVNIFQTLQP